MRLSGCHNFEDLRQLARQRLPWPVFDYIDGAADDEATKARDTAAFDDVDLTSKDRVLLLGVHPRRRPLPRALRQAVRRLFRDSH